MSTWAVKPQRHTVGLNSKSRRKLNCKNYGKLTGHTYTGNDFTSFGRDADPLNGKGISEKCLEKRVKSQ